MTAERDLVATLDVPPDARLRAQMSSRTRGAGRSSHNSPSLWSRRTCSLPRLGLCHSVAQKLIQMQLDVASKEHSAIAATRRRVLELDALQEAAKQGIAGPPHG